MDDPKLKLPDFLIADLYKYSLVEMSNQPDLNNKSSHDQEIFYQKTELKILGEARSKIIVIVNSPDQIYLQDGELELLSKILKACGMTLADVGIVNISNQPLDYVILKEVYGIVQLLLFGVKTEDVKLPLSLPLFQPHNFNGLKIMAAPSLVMLNENSGDSIEMKKKLWAVLKKWLV